MNRAISILPITLLLALLAAPGRGQSASQTMSLNETGHVVVRGRAVPYLIRRLPVSSFPDLPVVVQNELVERGCMIPQTYQAHRPENVVRGSLQRVGSSDWAVLCAVQGKVSLLVFFASAPDRPVQLAEAAETARLQPHDPSGVLGFNWGIDPASPQRVHDAQAGMDRRTEPLDHDALADSKVDRSTVYHYYNGQQWTVLNGQQSQ